MVPSSDTPHGAPFARTRRCILVVEDELLIRFMLSEELREAGYDAIEACNADEALAVLKSSVRVDLVISDVRMPGSLDGLGLLTFVRATRPTLPVIMISAHLEPRLAIDHGATQFLAKPFKLGEVLDMVRAELAKVS